MKNYKQLILLLLLTGSMTACHNEQITHQFPNNNMVENGNQVCQKARQGFDKHGGKVLFDNGIGQCYMVSALQIFLHSAPIFDAICELNPSEIEPGSSTSLIYELFKDIYDPNRDVSKVYSTKWFGKSLEELLGVCGTSYDAGTFFGKLFDNLLVNNSGNALADVSRMLRPLNEGKSLEELLRLYIDEFPLSPAPPVLFVRLSRRAAKDFVPSLGFTETMNIPGLGTYKPIGVAIYRASHWTARVKDLKTGGWENINSIPSISTPITFDDVIKDLDNPNNVIGIVALVKADYKMRH